MVDESSSLRKRIGVQKSTAKLRMSRATEFLIANKLLFYVFILCVATLAVLYRPETGGSLDKEGTDG